MIAALGRLGKLTKVQTKTTYILAPKRGINWRHIRAAKRVENNSSNTTMVSVVDLNHPSGANLVNIYRGIKYLECGF